MCSARGKSDIIHQRRGGVGGEKKGLSSLGLVYGYQTKIPFFLFFVFFIVFWALGTEKFVGGLTI